VTRRVLPTRRILAALQADVSDDAAWRLTRTSVSRLGVVLSLALVALYTVIFLWTLLIFPLWGPFATFDEQLQYYQAGRNFVAYGFTATWFLPDLATGSSATQHPYVYNHQPPGPQLLIGVLGRLLGERYGAVRLVFAGLAVLGLLTYVRFLRDLEGRGFVGAALALGAVAPVTVMHLFDHPAYSLFPLFAFLPVLLVDRSRTTHRMRWRALALLLVLVSSNYLLYGPTILIVAFWVFGALAGALPLSRKDLLLFMLTALVATILHLLQTVALVGPTVFTQELLYTLSNRVAGYPPREALRSFYDSIGFVMYGGHTLTPRHVVGALGASLKFPGWVLAPTTLTILLVHIATVGRSWPISPLIRVAAWTLLPAVVPTLMFPAFASDYGLHGVHEFLTGILAVALVVSATRLIDGLRSRPVQATLAVALAAAVMLTALAQAAAIVRAVWRTARWSAAQPLESGLQWVKDNLNGQVVLTNIDPIALGFLTREVAVGGCNRPAVVSSPLDPTKCSIRFIRDWPTRRPLGPLAYVWVAVGNRFCQEPLCASRGDLDTRYLLLFGNPMVAVYDLSTGPSP
jgi:hypothetical protein